jgi:hypothetical protein
MVIRPFLRMAEIVKQFVRCIFRSLWVISTLRHNFNPISRSSSSGSRDMWTWLICVSARLNIFHPNWANLPIFINKPISLTVSLFNVWIVWGIQPHNPSLHGDGLLLPRLPHRALACDGVAAVASFGRNRRCSRPPGPSLLEVSSYFLV